MAHPAMLRTLVERYEALQVLHAEQGTTETLRRLEDITYTLCVSTGTRTIEAALTTAAKQIGAALVQQAVPVADPPAAAAPAQPA